VAVGVAVRVGVGVGASAKLTTDHPASAVTRPVSARVMRRLVVLVKARVNHPTPGLSSELYGDLPPRCMYPPRGMERVVETLLIVTSFCRSELVKAWLPV